VHQPEAQREVVAAGGLFVATGIGRDRSLSTRQSHLLEVFTAESVQVFGAHVHSRDLQIQRAGRLRLDSRLLNARDRLFMSQMLFPRRSERMWAPGLPSLWL